MSSYSFPTSPIDGQRYPEDGDAAGKTQFQWVASKGVWDIVPSYIKLGNQASSNSYSWPLTDGPEGYQLTTNGEGGLSWAEKGSSSLVPINLDATPDGVRFQFTLLDSDSNPYIPIPSSNLLVFLGGIPQIPNVAYTLEDDQITFSEPPQVGVNFHAVSSVTLQG